MEETAQGQEAATGTGIPATLRRMAVTLAAALQNRVQLLSLELHEERAWYFSTAVLAVAALFFAGCAVLVGTIAIVMFCPASARAWVLVGFAVLYGALAAGFGLNLRRRTAEKPPALKDTLEQLKKDIECFRLSE